MAHETGPATCTSWRLWMAQKLKAEAGKPRSSTCDASPGQSGQSQCACSHTQPILRPETGFIGGRRLSKGQLKRGHYHRCAIHGDLSSMSLALMSRILVKHYISLINEFIQTIIPCVAGMTNEKDMSQGNGNRRLRGLWVWEAALIKETQAIDLLD